MITVLLTLVLHLANTDSTVCVLQVDPPSKPVNFAAQITGRLLDYGVRAGMTPDQVSRVFGSPDLASMFSTICGTSSDTSVTYFYRRYGVIVCFPSTPNLPTGQSLHGDRVHGGIE